MPRRLILDRSQGLGAEPRTARGLSFFDSGGHGQGGLQQRGLLGPPGAELGGKLDRVSSAKSIASCLDLRARPEARQRGPCGQVAGFEGGKPGFCAREGWGLVGPCHRAPRLP